MEREAYMTTEEMRTVYIDQFCDLQKIKKANDGHENDELDYLIKKISAKLAALSVNVEDLTL